MKTYLRLIALLLLMAISSLVVYGQDVYIIKSSCIYDYDGNRRFQDVAIYYPILYIYDNYNYSDATHYKSLSNSTNSDTYMTVAKNSNVGLYLDYRDFQAASSWNPKMLYYKITSPKTYTGQSHYDEIWACHGGCKTHKGRISFNVEAYDAPRFTSVDFPDCNDKCGAGNVCVSSSSNRITFYYTSSNNGSGGIYLEVRNDANTLIKSVNLGNIGNTGSNTQTLSALGLTNRYGEKIKFRFKVSIGGQTIYSDYSNSYTFFKQVPAGNGSITTSRQPCYPYVKIKVPLHSEVVANLSSYEFRAGNEDERISNPVILSRYGSISNNVITLIGSDNDARQLLNFQGNYTLQIFQNAQNVTENTPLDEVECALDLPFSVGKEVELPNFSIIPETIGNTEFHISRHDTADGRVKLKISNIQNTDDEITAFYRIDAVSGATQPAYSSIPLDGITGATVNSRKSEWTFDNHEGDVTYRYYLRDGNGCSTATQTFMLNKPDPITISVADNTKVVTCHAENAEASSNIRNDGEIYLEFSGGIPPYDIFVDGIESKPNYPNTSAVIDGLSEKDFIIRIEDNYGEVSNNSIVPVDANTELELKATTTDLTCYNDKKGEVSLNLSGNKVPGDVVFELLGQPSHNPTKNSFDNFPFLYAGTYTATATNFKGCKATLDSIEVKQPPEVIVDALGSKIARFGDSTGTINVNITGGWTSSFNYELQQYDETLKSGVITEPTIIENLKFGDKKHGNAYKILAVDGNGCEGKLENIQVVQPDSALKLYTMQQNVDCNGNATGEVYPTATGGWGHYQYGFNGTVHGKSNIINGLTATGAIADTVFVVDSAGIIEKLPVTITEPTQLVAAIDNIYNLKCFEDNSGAVKLNISGGTKEYKVKTDYTDWEDGDSISVLPIMENEPVYVLDANDCPSQVDVTITQPDKIAISVDTVIDAFCGQDNGGISTLVSGGTEAYAFNWTYLDSLKSVPINSNIIGGIYSGQYKLILSDAHECSDSLIVSISDTDGPEILAYTIDSISCFGGTDGKLTIQQVDGGMPEYAYYLDGIEGGTTFEGLENKTYHFRLLDKKGCKLDKYYTIPEPEDIAIVGTVINPVCHDSYDGFIATQISGGNAGYTYNWSNSSIEKDLQTLNSGNYTLTVTDKKACQKSESFEVIPPLAPTANLDHNMGVLCTGNSLELDGGDYISYQWYKDAVLVSEDRYLTVDQTGQYTLRISNQLGCIGVDTFDLEVSDTPLDAAIIVKDSAMIDEVVEAIDVTWPVPDSVQWYFDYPVELVENNSWMQQFSASTSGVVNVTLRAWYGGCFSDSSKTVTIYYEEGGIIERSAMNEPLILGYKAYPNPNDGNFFVGIELSREADIRLQLFNVGSASVVDVKEQYGLDSYDVPFNLSGLRPGVYVIVLIAEREQQKLKIVID